MDIEDSYSLPRKEEPNIVIKGPLNNKSPAGSYS